MIEIEELLMDAGLKRARLTSLSIVLVLAIGSGVVGALQHYGILPERDIVSGRVVAKEASKIYAPKVGIVMIEETLKKFDIQAQKKPWKETFTVAKTFPNYAVGQQLVVVTWKNNTSSQFRSSLAPMSETFMVGDQVFFGTVRYAADDRGNFSENQYYVQHKK